MMKTTVLHRIVAAAMVALIALSMSGLPRKGSDWDEESRSKKAEYVFMESQNAYGQETYDDYVVLAKRAFDLDSSDLDNAAEWGMILMLDTNCDSVQAEKAFQWLKNRFYTGEPDYLTGMTLANIARRRVKLPEVVRVWEVLDSAYPALSQPSEELAQAYLFSTLSGHSSDYDKVLAIYDRLEAGSGKSVGLSSQKIRAYSLMLDTAAIEREIEDLINFAPSDSYVALFAGSNYQYLNKNDMALKYYDLACRLDSTNGNAFMAKAALYSLMGDSVGFDREVFVALRSLNLEVEPKLEILRSYVSELYTDSTQENRIRQIFGELEQMHPGEPEIHNLFAAYLFEIKDYKKAAEEMGYSVSLDPANENSLSLYVQMLNYAEDIPNAILVSLEGMNKFPHNLYFAISAADGYRTKGNVKRAREIVDSVKIDVVDNARAVSNFYAFKGDICALDGDTIDALKAYDFAIDLNPDNIMALNNSAYFMAENGIDLDKAEKYSAIAVRNDGTNPTYLDTYAWIFFKKKDYTLARQYIDMTINLFNSEESKKSGNEEYEPSAEVYDHAGDIYFMDGEPGKALEFWKKALELDPENKHIEKKVKHKTYFYK